MILIGITRIKLLMPFSGKGNPKFMFMLGIFFSMVILLIVPVVAIDPVTENNSVQFQTISATSLSPAIREEIIAAITEKKA